ncbi:MAG: hypothetical protein RSC10_05345 [Longicatena sp.]
MKDKVNILFVCGYGVGSSAISESIVKKALVIEKINAEVKHTAVGEMDSMKEWTDIIVISTKLAEGVSFKENEHVIKVINVMDGKGIAASVGKIIDEFYPNARQSEK